MILYLTKRFNEFYNSGKTGGFILIGCTLVSILIANSPWGEGYVHFWHEEVGFSFPALNLRYPLEYWINDGLMAVFFLLIGLEIERELYKGELSDFKNALLPLFAAVGGMAVPALIHFSLNAGSPTQAGIGIPMATDIAFALGILSLLGSRVPASLKIFLTALAIIDDLGAIIIIAIFYTKGFSLFYFGIAMLIYGGLILMNRLKIRKIALYIIPGIVMWYFMLNSGVHATVTGVLLAFAIPFSKVNNDSPSYHLEHNLHKPVAFIILPVFALANTGIVFSSGWYSVLLSPNSLGIIAGLFIGKPLGIFLFSFIAMKMGICGLPDDVSWKHVLGAGLLGGIGFTMSIFITLLAFSDPDIITGSKIAVLTASVLSATAGFILLKNTKKKILTS